MIQLQNLLRPRSLLAVAATVAAIAAGPQARAQNGVAWFGYDGTFQASGASHIGYAGALLAIPGTLANPGWRLRLDVVGGFIHYDRAGGTSTRASGLGASVSVGYNFRWGRVSVTPFAGIAGRTYDTKPLDIGTSLETESFGIPVGADIDVAVTRRISINAIGRYTILYNSYWARVRGGYQIAWHNARIGPEVLTQGGDRWNRVRAGLFISGIKLGPASLELNGGATFDTRCCHSGGYFGAAVSFAF